MFVEPIVQFRTQSNWEFGFEGSREAAVVNAKIQPIPLFEIGYLFDSHILAVRASTENAKPGWKYGGKLRQKIQIGSGGAVSALPNVTAQRVDLDLNDWTLAIFPKFYSEYQLVYVPPRWFKDVTLKVYQYVGPQSSNLIDLLNEVKSDVLRVESKVDQL